MKYFWTLYVSWDDGETEELDIPAESVGEAVNVAAEILDAEYEPGWSIRNATRTLGVLGASS